MKALQKLALASLSLLAIACSDDDDNTTTPTVTQSFTVTVENVSTPKMYFSTQTTGLITPGNSASYTFNAGKGNYLQFATMFVKSNDLFYAPNDMGIALYDTSGTALTGDITSMISLWDAGTEVNEMPGSGANQPPNQGSPNTGTTENSVVKAIAAVNDGFTYPATNTVLKQN